MKIYIKDSTDISTPKDLMDKFYPKNHAESGVAITTYKDELCEHVQCHYNKYRSFSDFMYIFKTYFPEITEKELIDLLFEKGLLFAYCNSVRKIVCVKYPNYSNYKYIHDFNTNNHKFHSFDNPAYYDDGITLETLLNFADITHIKEMREHFKDNTGNIYCIEDLRKYLALREEVGV